MKQEHYFKTLEDFIDHLKNKDEIIGIVQYGNRDYKNMSVGGDYDLNIIVDDKIETNIAGLHLHVNSIPVDCGIISIKDLFLDESPSDFHSILVDSRIIYDKNGSIEKQLKKIKEKWKLNIIPIKEGELAFERFIKQHVVDKFEHRLFENEVYTRIFLSGNIFSLLEAYMKINELNPYDFKNALQIMKENDNHIYKLFEEFVTNNNLENQISVTKEINNKVFNRYGGVWNKNEIVFHYKNSSDELSQIEKQKILNLIF